MINLLILNNATMEKRTEFLCGQCNITFVKKFQLRRHEKFHLTVHNSNVYFCGKCKQTFATYLAAQQHEKDVHINKKFKQNVYTCDECEEQCNNRTEFEVHWNHRHYSKVMPLRICPVCGMDVKVKDIIGHLRNEHGIRIYQKLFTFQYENDFVEWKIRLEEITRSQFTLEYNSKKEGITKYGCNRSAIYSSFPVCTKNLETNGTTRIHGHCPASILVKKLPQSKTFEVRLISTHVGHASDQLSTSPDRLTEKEEEDTTKPKSSLTCDKVGKSKHNVVLDIYTCDICEVRCENRIEFELHWNRDHFGKVMPLRICPLCKSDVKSQNLICHLHKQHGIQINSRTYIFFKAIDFFKWKRKIERQTKSKFFAEYKSRKGAITKYTCYRSTLSSNFYYCMNNLKINESIKIYGYCPASMLFQKHATGEFTVRFIATHIGHECIGQDITQTHKIRPGRGVNMKSRLPEWIFPDDIFALKSLRAKKLSRKKCIRKRRQTKFFERIPKFCILENQGDFYEVLTSGVELRNKPSMRKSLHTSCSKIVRDLKTNFGRRLLLNSLANFKRKIRKRPVMQHKFESDNIEPPESQTTQKISRPKEAKVINKTAATKKSKKSKQSAKRTKTKKIPHHQNKPPNSESDKKIRCPNAVTLVSFIEAALAKKKNEITEPKRKQFVKKRK